MLVFKSLIASFMSQAWLVFGMLQHEDGPVVVGPGQEIFCFGIFGILCELLAPFLASCTLCP